MSVWLGILSRVAEAGVSALWQAAVVAALVALVVRAGRGMPAAGRFRLWMGGFVAAAFLPFALYALRNLFAGHADAVVVANAPVHALVTLGAGWSLVWVAAWAVLATFGGLRLLVGLMGVRRLVREADEVEIGGSAWGVGFIGSRRVRVLETDAVEGPVAAGFWHAAIVLPKALVAELSGEEMRQVVLHEMEHLRRHDDWTTLLVRALRCLMPMSPALWWMERRLDREREMACDEAVLSNAVVPRAYALCLARMAEQSLKRRTALMPGLLGEASQLGARVGHILSFVPGHDRKSRRPIAAVAAAAMVVAAVALSECPSVVRFAEPVEASPVIAAQSLTPAAQATVPVKMMAQVNAPKAVRRVLRHRTAPVAATPEVQAAENVVSEMALNDEQAPVSAELTHGGMVAQDSAKLMVTATQVVVPSRQRVFKGAYESQPVLLLFVDPVSGALRIAIVGRGVLSI